MYTEIMFNFAVKLLKTISRLVFKNRKYLVFYYNASKE